MVHIQIQGHMLTRSGKDLLKLSHMSSRREMVDSGIPIEGWEVKLKKTQCETSPKPSDGCLCTRMGPMATQIHTYPTRGTTRPGQIRDFILFYTCCVVMMDLWYGL